MAAFHSEDHRNFVVHGISVNVPTMNDAIASVIMAAEQGRSFSVFTLNLSHVVHMRADGDFLDAYRSARFVTADGFPIAMLARMAGLPIERTTGSDMLTPMCQAASDQGLPIFLLGSSKATLDESKKRLEARFKAIKIVGTHSPGLPFDPHSHYADEAIELIRTSGAKLCFLALGTPRQEIFAARCLKQLPGTGILCFGAALDFLAGTQERAPLFAQKYGLEWAWRTFREPRRLAPRYAQCLATLPRLVAATLPQILSTQLGISLGTQRWRH